MLQRRRQDQDLHADVEDKFVSDSERAVDHERTMCSSAPGFGWGLFYLVVTVESGRKKPRKGELFRSAKSDGYIDPGREDVLKVVENKGFVTASQQPAKPGQDNAEKKH